MGGFFVPFMNPVRPFRVAREIWKASDPTIDASDGFAWTMTPSSPLLGFWWAFWLISNIVGNFVLRTSFRTDTIEDLITLDGAAVVSDLLSTGSGILAVFVVRAINARQEVKHRRLATLGPWPEAPWQQGLERL